MIDNQTIKTEYLESDPTATIHTKKKILRDGEWVDRIFIRIPVAGTDKYYRSKNELEQWCYDHYKEPRYLGPWFKVSGYIILDEQVYTHWKLCE